MWSMFAAPLEIAADIRHMPNASASILLNKEVIAVNQDSLVQQGRRVGNYGGT
jgi:alpha-galactosidase